MSFPSKPPEQSMEMSATRAAAVPRAVFFTASALVYATVSVIATLALNPYFSQTWDVNTFIQAGHRFLDGGNPFDLYAQSRAAQTWPYAYPPLHAVVTAMALSLGKLFPFLPEFVWARMPALLADIGIGLVLYNLVRRTANEETMAQAAMLLWLFNPVTFYDTAVQGHFESEWLLFILLAYMFTAQKRSTALTTLALATAVLFKQIAIIFAAPVWLYAVVETGSPLALPSRIRSVLSSLVFFTIVVGAVCLPFLLYSDDFLYMNLTYVENVPMQTQSWLVAVLGLVRDSPNAMTSDFFLLRYQTLVTISAAVVIALWGARHRWSLYLTGALIALALFLTSKKVMGYYYVMLFPFLFAELLPRRRIGLVLTAIVGTTLISLSPYYGGWTNHSHWWVYAALGILCSVFFVWISAKLVSRQDTAAHEMRVSSRTALVLTLGLFAGAAGSAFLQPFAPASGSPIRAPIVGTGMEWAALITFGVLVGLITLSVFIFSRATGAMNGALSRWTWHVCLLFAPLFFSVYTLTKESTAIFEIALKALGV